MSVEQNKKQEKHILIAYLLMLLTILSVVPIIMAYWLAFRISHTTNVEVWLNSHALWIARSLMIFVCIAIFAALWFIPLGFFAWNSSTWVNASVMIGGFFAITAWLYLINAWLKGIIRYFQRKPVY
ncbi:MAG: hypothetical protein E6Q25_06015 [Acinetobacter sp.]|jgi:glucan phosphoethanolaminetransferase (alkaline phosphatase superfamily)|nr:MAG: hypothetical protein E6Q25_06015 [Acinetobacter sp.]